MKRIRFTLTLVHGTKYWKVTKAAPRALTRAQKGANWTALVGISISRNGPGNAGLAREVVGKTAADFQSWLGAIPAYANPVDWGIYVSIVFRDLTWSGDLADMTTAMMRSLVGRQKPTLQELTRLIAIGLDLASRASTSVGVDVKFVMNVPGISAFFATLVTRSGFQHGGVGEILAVAVLIKGGIDPSALRFSPPMLDGRLGADIAHYVIEGANLFDMKALRDIARLTRSTAKNAIFRQTRSHMLRLAAQKWKLAAQGLDGSVDASTPFTGKLTFGIDFEHFVKTHKNPSELVRDLVHEIDGTGRDLDALMVNGQLSREVLLENLVYLADTFGDQLTGAYAALRSRGPLLPDAREGLLATLRDLTNNPTLLLADVEPELFRVLEIFSPADAQKYAGKKGEELLRPAVIRLAGFTDESIATMPPPDIRVVVLAGGAFHGGL